MASTDAVQVPPAEEWWHPLARTWYESLETSAQARFYEPSYWMTAYVLAETMSRELGPQSVVNEDGSIELVELAPKASWLAAWLRGLGSLMVTEVDRRWMHVEIDRSDRPSSTEGGGDVSELAEYRSRLQRSQTRESEELYGDKKD